MDSASLKEIYEKVERYVVPLLGGDVSSSSLSKEENRILALQQINRLNQRIGQIARSNAGEDTMTEMKILQRNVNNLTIGVKTDNTAQSKAALATIRSYIWSSS
jgi:hypothetical protein